MDILLTGILMGLGATVAMDLWALILEAAAGVPRPNWAMPGRWLGHLARGRVFHEAIGDAAPVPGELGLGWALHYGVGVVYGVALAAIIGRDWLAAPSFLPAWIFALLTISAGWFLLQPGMGLGWAASRTPNPWKVRGLGLAAHTAFGLGLWGTALVV
jgi:hypothetical protein